MKKQKWTEKPVTWGGYAMLCVICAIVETIYGVCYYAALCQPDWWVDFKEFVKRSFTRKIDEE